MTLTIDPLESVLEDVRAGKPVVIVDDTDRENEGDLCVAAERVTPESIAFMIREGRGLVCLSMEASRLSALRIPMQVSDNRSRFGTNFTVSIDHGSVGEQGVTAASRAKTILRAISDDAVSDEFRMPGFVFPLCAQPGGVLRRRGQTEGAVDLARLAGLKPAGAICEVMGADGRMLRGEGLMEFCRRWQLKLTSVEDICQYRLRTEVSLRRVAECSLAALLKKGAALCEMIENGNGRSKGEFRAVVFVDDVTGEEHLGLVCRRGSEPLSPGCLVRVHSECLTGDVLGSARCDCGYQFRSAVNQIQHAGEGVILYLHQEGRGIGLGNKLRAYALQDDGLDTVDANIHLGFCPDDRSYRVAAQMLSDFGLKSVRLITNNPEKIKALEDYKIEVMERVPLEAPRDRFNRVYLETKRDRLGHLLA